MSSCKTRDFPAGKKESLTLENNGYDKEEIGKETKDSSYGFYSRELKQVFDTLDELKMAESKHHEKLDAEAKAKMEKTADAKKVEDAYKHLLEVKAKSAKEIREAEQMYNKERNAFIEKHGSYHMTYTNRNGEECLSVSDLVDSIWEAFGSPFRFLK
jgi:Skp family chaperone for outer membrane proteins